MPVNKYWHDEKKTIFVTQVEGVWTLDDFYQYYEEVAPVIAASPHPVVMISDLSKSGRAPKQFLSVGRFMSRRRIPTIKLTIVVGVSTFGQTLMNILYKAYPSARRAMMTRTLEEAIKIAEETIQELEANQPAT